MEFLLLIVFAVGGAEKTVPMGRHATERACIGALLVELDRAHRRGIQVVGAECRPGA